MDSLDTSHPFQPTKKATAALLKSKCSEARLALLDGDLADLMRPVEEWPRTQMQHFLGEHVGFNARCNLFYFFAVNGVPPCIWVKWATAQRGWLAYDKSALDVADLMKAWMKGDFEGDNGKALKTAWCMERHEVVTVYTPNFAFDEVGSWHFEDAIAELQQFAKMLPRKKSQGRW